MVIYIRVMHANYSDDDDAVMQHLGVLNMRSTQAS
jgi:hypothetical protein